MAKLIQIFPLSIYKDQLVLDEAYRVHLLQVVLNTRHSDGSEPKPANSAWLGDISGHEFLFQRPEFEELFRRIAAGVRKYIEMLGLNDDRMHLYFQRAWSTVSEKGERISEHRHEQSNISVAYYLAKHRDAGNLRFITDSHPNEFSPGLFSPSKQELGMIRHPSLHTWNQVTLEVAEGDLVIFPSKTLHATEPNRTPHPRVSISADITVMLRESAGHETMMPHFSQWRSFEHEGPERT